MHLAHELLMNVQCSGGSRSFCKGKKSLEDEEHSGWPLKIDNGQLGTVIEADPLTTTWEVAEELSFDHSAVIWHLKQIGKVRKLSKWMPHELTKKWKKVVILQCRLLLFCVTTMNHILIRLWHVMKSGFYMTTDDDQLSVWTKKQLQSISQCQTCTKMRSWSLFGVLLLFWSTTAFWILTKLLHLRNMLSKSVRCTKNCSACSQLWSTDRAQVFSMTMSDCTLHNQCFKGWMNLVTKFCLIHHIHLTSHQLITTSSSILTPFFQGKWFHNQQAQKILYKKFVESWSTDFLWYKNKQTNFSLAKMYWL